MVNNEIFGYIGLVFSMIYRIPQIVKIYKTKKGEDISTKTFILHNCAYLFLLTYTARKLSIDYLMISYYINGIVQNLLIVIMKKYYKKIEIQLEI